MAADREHLNPYRPAPHLEPLGDGASACGPVFGVTADVHAWLAKQKALAMSARADVDLSDRRARGAHLVGELAG